jgi:hypothetical protein
MAKERFQRRQAFGPQAFVRAEPFIGLREWPGIDLAVVGPPAHGAPDETGQLECLDVFGRRGERHPEWFGEFAYRVFLPRQPAEHGAPRGVAQGAEDAIEVLRLHNHVVEYIGCVDISQPGG